MIQLSRERLCITILALGLVIGAMAAVTQSRQEPKLSASNECKTIVKKLEGDHYYQLTSLDCKLEPRVIGNSALTARYYRYTTRTATSDCDGIDPGFDASCAQDSGVITSDGKIHRWVGDLANFVPYQYDYCYSLRYDDSLNYPIPSTKHDLYFFWGELWERYVFDNVSVKTRYGTCMFNGTVLVNGHMRVITNMAVTYKDFPADCQAATLGGTQSDWQDCWSYVAAAYQRHDVCSYDNDDLPIYDNNKIVGYRSRDQVRPRFGLGAGFNEGCERAYVERMAALRQCSQVMDAALKQQCQKDLDRPSGDDDLERLFSTI